MWKNKNINDFINKEYIGNIFQLKNDILLKIFDTNSFYASEIEALIYVKVYKDEENNLIVKIKLDNQLIKIDFEEILNITE